MLIQVRDTYYLSLFVRHNRSLPTGKSHLTGKKSRTVTMRLNQKGYFEGQMHKNMSKLIAR